MVNGLPDFFKKHKGPLPAGDQKPHEHGALQIALKGETGMMSYKAAWEAEAAKMALASTGMYEASANFLWLNPFPSNNDGAADRGEPALMVSVDRGSGNPRDEGCGPGTNLGRSSFGATAGESQVYADDVPVDGASVL